MPDSKASILNKIPISEIKDNVVLLKDGALRGILMTNSLNFSLKSTDEQDAITYRYQDFLNSLDFPIQILSVTRRYDISDYITMLEQKRGEQENELLKIQISEYTDFIKGLTQMVNIMSTFFYIIVPFSQSQEQQVAGFSEKLTGLFKNKRNDQASQTYEEMKSGLWQRLEYIISGLSALGLKTVILNSDEILELFYRMYNPDAKEKIKMEPQQLT
ncbi:MAG: hypothetical protein A2174_02070 [Candidatus Portnoybacteria bacterium RBG_13_41_18]|uniref:TraC-like domain-containing protein n=1 Tax=Candidatus Portnoybacteria bacterium RBG_13_41_18 TaxID=1801991 RepID=A0A1G2F894_9BACT|nr:MAG: hypothetical protein A2174_02070 [Candidatus Portnoybacteria bacterium RBG_13_41_18]